MRQKVIVVGGGIAGLTAAQELIERDFEVHLIERRSIMGGKASSRRAGKEHDLPAEHGFRFFPGWYRHVPDTMKRIPFKGRRKLYEGKSVFDNLINVHANLLVWYDRDPLTAPMHLPRSFDQLRALGSFFVEMQKLELAPAELSFFFTRLAEFLATPESEKLTRFQNITWWQYLDADNKSRAFKDLISATTRTMVAAKANEASAYTVCRLALRTIFDAVSNVDRILNGPTNEKWIDPWVDYLDGRGVVFHRGWELRDISFAAKTPKDEGQPKITGLRYGFVAADNLDRLRSLLLPIAADLRAITLQERLGQGNSGPAQALRARFGENVRSFRGLYEEAHSGLGEHPSGVELDLAEHLEICKALVEAGQHVAELYQQLRLIAPATRPSPGDPAAWARSAEAEAWKRAKAGNDGFADLLGATDARLAQAAGVQADDKALNVFFQSAEWGELKRDTDILFATYSIQCLDDKLRHLKRQIPLQPEPPESADYYVMALPVEQMAYYVNRSVAATTHDPELERIVRLADYTDWMAGIQFYLSEHINIGQGHLVGMDSDWGLTAIEQIQFWDDVKPWRDEVKSIISVDIAAWDKRGRFVNKEAFNCTNDEIAEEVWQELVTSLSSDHGLQRLRTSMLIGGKLEAGKSYVLDDSIVELCDRRKQGCYEKARSVHASTLPAAEARANAKGTVPYVFGPRLRFNVEPLLVNRVGTHALRPAASTKISNLFLASDYVATETDLACMEGANEAARRAVNALLQVAGSDEDRCELWDFSAPGNMLEQLTSAAKLGNVAGGAAKTAGKALDTAFDLATRTADAMRGFWEKRR